MTTTEPALTPMTPVQALTAFVDVMGHTTIHVNPGDVDRIRAADDERHAGNPDAVPVTVIGDRRVRPGRVVLSAPWAT